MNLASNFPSEAKNLLLVSGKNLMDTLGLPELRRIVAQLLNGVNIRLATEPLTQRRIHLINISLTEAYSKIIDSGITFEQFTSQAHKELQSPKTSRADKIILRWMLGLTGKLADNVLRSEEDAAKQYLVDLKETLSITAEIGEEQFHNFLSTEKQSSVSWEWSLSLLMAVGAQTLATRGSEKSLYGKFFEKMVMGSVLSVLGFQLAEKDQLKPGSFTLSTTSKRESDATVLWHSDIGIRFDIGFIGKGNPEITLDKVTRFERDIELFGRKTSLKTIIIVDKIGEKSKVETLAKKVDGLVIQMSNPLWVKDLANSLEDILPDYESPVKSLKGLPYSKFIEKGVQSAPLERIFKISIPDDSEDNVEE